MRLNLLWAVTALLALLMTSCNIYSPLTAVNSTDDILEEAQKCLHDGDYDCAIEQYNALSDSTLKSQKLCMANLAKGGVTLYALINVLPQGTSAMMGNLANQLLPHSDAKQSALDSAKTHCVAFGAASTEQIAVLLKTVSLLSHCAIRMTKTDTLVANSDSDTVCTTAGNQDGVIDRSDISDTADGNITAVGMCATDVSACNEDIVALPDDELAAAGLSNIKASYDAMPAALKTSSAATIPTRGSLKSMVSE